VLPASLWLLPPSKVGLNGLGKPAFFSGRSVQIKTTPNFQPWKSPVAICTLLPQKSNHTNSDSLMMNKVIVCSCIS